MDANLNARVRELAAKTDVTLYLTEPDSNPSPLAFAMLRMFQEKYPGLTATELCDVSGEMEGLADPPDMEVWTQVTDGLNELMYKIRNNLPYGLVINNETGFPERLPEEADQLVYACDLQFDNGQESLFFAHIDGCYVAVSNFGDCSMAAAPWMLTCRKADLLTLFPDVKAQS